VAETVAPVVHGVRRWLIAVGAFAAGAVAAGAALGWALGSAAAWAGGGSTHAAWAAAAIVAAYAGREAGILRLPVPQLRRQVPQRWREILPLPATAFLYGAGLGVGFVTYVPVATFAAVVAAIVLADPAAGAVALAAFGAGRAIVLVAATAGLRDWDEAADRFERAGRWLRAGGGGLRTANAGAMAALAGVLVATTAPAAAVAAVQEQAMAERDAAVQAALQQAAVLQRQQLEQVTTHHRELMDQAGLRQREQLGAHLSAGQQELAAKKDVIDTRLDQVQTELRAQMERLGQLVGQLGQRGQDVHADDAPFVEQDRPGHAQGVSDHGSDRRRSALSR